MSKDALPSREDLWLFRSNLQRTHDRLVVSAREYEQGEASGLSYALDIFDLYFGEVK